MVKTYKVKSGNWYKDVQLETKEDIPYRDAAMEAATIAVENFFQGRVRVHDINSAHTIDAVIIVTGKEYEPDTHYDTYLYAPIVLANAGLHEEATLLHQKINLHNYESTLKKSAWHYIKGLVNWMKIR